MGSGGSSAGLARLAGLAGLACLAALAVTLYAVAVLGATPPHPDLDAYRHAASDFLSGRPLYADFLRHSEIDATLRPAFIYPPITAALLAPLALLPGQALPWLWLAATQAALVTSMVLVFRRQTRSRTVLLLAITATFSFYPLWVDSSQGQLNLFVMLLVTAAVTGISAGRPQAGFWLGLGSAIKLTPATLLAWLVVERRARPIIYALIGASLASAIGLALRADDTAVFVSQVLPALSKGTAYYSNQSLAGVMARLLTVNPYTRPLVVVAWEPAAAVTGSALLLLAWALTVRSVPSPRWRAFTMLPLLALISPVSWEHHLVILLPLIWVCLVRLEQNGWPRGYSAALGLAGVCLMAIPHLPLGPPYGTVFARAAETANPLLILGANRLFAGTLLLFVAGLAIARLPDAVHFRVEAATRLAA